MTLQQIEKLKPNHKGYIRVFEDGAPRIFLKAKLIDYLSERTPGGEKKPAPEKIVKPKRVKKIKVQLPPKGASLRIAVIAKFPEGREQQFESCATASRELKIYKSGITRVMQGKLPDINGVQFRRAQ